MANLSKVAKEDKNYRTAFAVNIKNTSVSILEQLSRDKDSEVRQAVATNIAGKSSKYLIQVDELKKECVEKKAAEQRTPKEPIQENNKSRIERED